MAKTGSALNHAFEFWIVSALFRVAGVRRADSSSETPPGTFAVAAALFVLPLVFAVGHLAGSERIIRVIGLSASSNECGWDRLRSSRSARRSAIGCENCRRRCTSTTRFSAAVERQPRSLSGDRARPRVLRAARAQGRLEHDGVLSLVESRYFGAVVAFVRRLSSTVRREARVCRAGAPSVVRETAR